ncbi:MULTISPECIES: prepilin-type N-terminal cleavage/methylation domain-containing protein [Acinetobacter]|nr:prepilin-type N-terminal cleavage/methylation domain-containing protein [Acinetobacter towneri]
MKSQRGVGLMEVLVSLVILAMAIQINALSLY